MGKDGSAMPTITFKYGHRIRTFGGWYRHDYVYVDGIELMGFIQVRWRNRRTESTTHFQFLSSAVLGTDVEWLYRMNKTHEQELISKSLLSGTLPTERAL
jgi:hypothetical protein